MSRCLGYTELKRWILGTHQGSISNAHLEYYLDEFTFRFNLSRDDRLKPLKQWPSGHFVRNKEA
jgi:transposase-like protein